MLERKELGPTAFARMVVKATGDQDFKPQHVNNWRRRGVPSTHANLVAVLLECRPEVISAAIPAAQPAKAEEPTGSRLTDSQQMILAMCKGFSPDQMAVLATAAGWIREGREIVTRDPPQQLPRTSGNAKESR